MRVARGKRIDTERIRARYRRFADHERRGYSDHYFKLSREIADDERITSCDDFGDDAAVFLFQTFATGHGERARLNAKLVEYRRMDIGYVMSVFDCVKAKLIGRAVCDSTLDAAPRHPHTESIRMMIAPIAMLRPGSSAELGRPHY